MMPAKTFSCLNPRSSALIRGKAFVFLRVSTDLGLAFQFWQFWQFWQSWQFSMVPTKILL